MTTLAIAALLCAACAPATGEEAATESEFATGRCSIAAASTGELSEGEICALFAGVSAADRGSRVDIAMPSDHQATARLIAADGTVLAEAGASSSDRAMHRGAWERLARELTRQRG